MLTKQVSVWEFPSSLSTVFLCKYRKVMWLCKSKGFHNFFYESVGCNFRGTEEMASNIRPVLILIMTPISKCCHDHKSMASDSV